jgi:hypothetical protein
MEIDSHSFAGSAVTCQWNRARLESLKGITIPRFPIEGIRFVATVIDCVGQRAQLGGCAYEAKDGSSNVLIAGCRSAEIVTPSLDFTNEAPGIWQVRDQLQVCERVPDQQERFGAGIMEAAEQLAQGLV